MKTTIESKHFKDAQGTPAGGHTWGTGFAIAWQNGPLKQELNLNGAFVEDVITAVIDRIAWYEDSQFSCPENREALTHLGQALRALNARTADREVRGVEGTHAV